MGIVLSPLQLLSASPSSTHFSPALAWNSSWGVQSFRNRLSFEMAAEQQVPQKSVHWFQFMQMHRVLQWDKFFFSSRLDVLFFFISFLSFLFLSYFLNLIQIFQYQPSFLWAIWKFLFKTLSKIKSVVAKTTETQIWTQSLQLK